MNNFTLQGRSVATATVAALCIAGHGNLASANNALGVAHQPLLHLNQVPGSIGLVNPVSAAMLAEQAAEFGSAVNAAFQRLSTQQQRLDVDMAQVLVQSAWDLYDEI